MADNYDIFTPTGASTDGFLKRTFAATESGSVLTPHSHVKSLPVQHIDSFSRLRTAEPGYRFDSQLTYQIDSDLWDTAVTNGTVAHEATERAATLTADASGANSAVLQSHYHAPYTPGRGQLAFITFVMGAAPATGGYKRAGYYDGANGIYLERTDSAVNLVLKSTTSKGTETVAQASWNLDPMDGTGPSGITLDLTKCQILAIQMQALYVGRVVVGFDIGGELVPVHQFLCANEEAVPYIAQANLPIRYEVGGTADTSAATVMHAICSSVISEGGQELERMSGRTFPAWGEVVNAAAGAVLVIRCKEQLNSIDQNALAIPDGLDVAVQDAGCWIEIRRNATVTAGTFEDVDTLSAVEVSYAGNAGTDPVVTAGTGTLVDRFYVPASQSIRTLADTSLIGKTLLCYSHLLGVADTISVIYNTGSGTTDVRCSLKWKEIR